MRRLGTTALVLMVLAGPAMSEEARAVPQIAVTGEGRVTAVPDMATVTLGVSAEAGTAREAMDQTSQGVAVLFETLNAAGVEARDIQTSGLALGPVWQQSRDGAAPPHITGYSASNNVTVRVRAIGDLGGLLDRALDGGVNTLNGVSFGIQEPEPRLDEARAAAVVDARRKAELYAKAAGVGLGRVLTISEGGGSVAPVPMYRMERAMAAPVPVAEGETELAAQVTVVWELAD